MPNQQLTEYIQNQLNNKVEDSVIKDVLVNAGWDKDEIEKSFNQIGTDLSPDNSNNDLKSPSTETKQLIDNKSLTTSQDFKVPDELIKYIDNKIQKGESKENISKALIDAGWNNKIIEDVMSKRETTTDVKPLDKEELHKENVQESKLPSLWNPESITNNEDNLQQETNYFPNSYNLDLEENFVTAYVLLQKHFLTILGLQIIPLILLAVTYSLYSSISNFSDFLLFISAFILFIITFIPAQISVIYSLSKQERNIVLCLKNSIKKVFPFITTSLSLTGIITSAFVFLAVPLFIFLPWFVFSPYISVTEKLKNNKALIKSRNYVKGYFWKVFFRTFLITILSGLVFAVLYLSTNLLFKDGSSLKTYWLSIQAIIQMIVLTYSNSFLYILFENIKNSNKEQKYSNREFIWVTKALTYFGFLCILAIIGYIIFLLGNALWSVMQETSTSIELPFNF